MEWSNDECLRLIDLYSAHEVLWNPKCPYYYAKNRKNEAWEAISFALSRKESAVKQKMSSLLGSFRSQRSRGKKSIGTGKATTEVYVSKWFAFERMRFLLDRDEPNTTLDSQSVNTTLDSQSGIGEVSQGCSLDGELLEEPAMPHIVHLDTSMAEDTAPDEAFTPRTPFSKRKRNQEDPRIEEALHVLKKASKNIEESKKEEMLDFFGKYVASKMKSYSQELQLTVEHRINEILAHADLGLL